MGKEKCCECDKELVLGEKGQCVYCELNYVKVNSTQLKDTSCGICNISVVIGKGSIYCELCKHWYHNSCIEQPLDDRITLLYDAPKNIKWFCDSQSERDTRETNCGICDIFVVREKGSLYCELCKRWYHNLCNETSLDDQYCSFLYDAPKNIKWFCDSHAKCIFYYAFNNDKQCGYRTNLKSSMKKDEKNVNCNKTVDIELKSVTPKGSCKKAKVSTVLPKTRTIKNKMGCSTKNNTKKITKLNETNKEDNNLDESDNEDFIETGKGSKEPELQPGESDTDSNYLGQDDQSEEDGLIPTGNKDSKEKSNKKYIACDKCPKYFYKEQDFEAHKLWHTGDKKPYKCPICKKGYPTKIKAKYHAQMHSDEKPFMCDICGIGFKREQLLISHMRVHSAERPYKCDVCEKGFRHQSNLRVHMFVHTKDKNYFCSVCGFGTPTKDRLTLHMKTVHKYKTTHNLTNQIGMDDNTCHDDNTHKQKIQSPQKSKSSSESNASDSNSNDSVPLKQHNLQPPPLLIYTGANDKSLAPVYSSSHTGPPTGRGSWGFTPGSELFGGPNRLANPSSAFNYYS